MTALEKSRQIHVMLYPKQLAIIVTMVALIPPAGPHRLDTAIGYYNLDQKGEFISGTHTQSIKNLHAK